MRVLIDSKIDDGLSFPSSGRLQLVPTSLAVPTPPQRMGWPVIASDEHPFSRQPGRARRWRRSSPAWIISGGTRGSPCVRIPISLKALNHDVFRNLQLPLEGILETSEAEGAPLPELTVAVRTGDTSSKDRQRLIRKPPDILITTPESLHLMLTSRARSTLGALSHVIIDEIHALCPNKRGVFLLPLLERLEAINPDGFIRIGLSATQRPLVEVASYLGGLEEHKGTDRRGSSRGRSRSSTPVAARNSTSRSFALPGRSNPIPEGST